MRGFFDDTKNYDKQWFINESFKLYGDQFTFENTNYISIRKDVVVTCKLHGDFKVRPFAFIRQKRHCKECHRIGKTELVLKKLQTITDNYVLDINSFKSISTKCIFFNTKEQKNVLISPHGLLKNLEDKQKRLANKKPKKIKPPPPPKIPFIPSVVATQNHHIVDNVTYIRKGKIWYVNNVYCQLYKTNYNATVLNFKMSKSDNCKHCKSDFLKIIGQQRQQKNNENLFNKLKNICSTKHPAIDFSNYSFVNTNIHIACKLHGPIRVNRSAAIRFVKTKNVEKLCSTCYKFNNSISLKFPSLLKDWDYNKNKISPNLVTKGHGNKIFWKCHRCQLSFQCHITHKIKLHNGCPGCTIKTSSRIERIIFYFIRQIFGHNNVLHNGRLKQKKQKVSYDMLIKTIHPNVIIEYDGSQYHKNKVQYDLNKISRINNMGYKCIRIREQPLTKLQPSLDIEYKFIDYNHQNFDNHITELIHDVLKIIQNNFQLTNTVQNKLVAGLNQKFSYHSIPKNFFLYPLLGTSMMDFHPELNPHWDLSKNILTLKQISKSDPLKRWWICEDCQSSFQKGCKPIINKLKTKQKVQCRTCVINSKPIIVKIKPVKPPFSNKNISYHNGKHVFKYNSLRMLTDLRHSIRDLTRSYVVTDMKIKNKIIYCTLKKRKMKKGGWQFYTEKVQLNFEINKKINQIMVWQ